MTKHADHEKIALSLRRNSPHWTLIDMSSTRSRVSGRAAVWKDPARQPAAFRKGGYEFRSRKDADRVFILEGRYIGTTPAPY